ncbi:MAG: 23S rRNA (adenine(2030)-N(6))-methyltransferase RlmJ [Pseudomonadota bacterium]
MNYRHAFHAGNFGDVVKHAALALAIERLKQKEAPFCVLDTHAGVGRYDLGAPEALKTDEFRAGIARLLEGAPLPRSLAQPLAPYLDVVREMNRGAPALRWYPGSPGLALALLRPQDRLVLIELQPEDAKRLAAAMAGEPRVKVHAADGYTGLKAFLPPFERRGLVLIDPPFEDRDEFQRLARGLGHAHRRWASGIYLLWYPIKDRAPVRAFHDRLKATGIRRILVAEVLIRPDADPDRLNGCGLVVVNPPWRFEATLAALLPELLGRLAERGGRAQVGELVPA